MKFILLMTVLVAGCGNVSLNLSDNSIDADEVTAKLKAHLDRLEQDEAQKYYSGLKDSKRQWCVIKYNNGKCKQKSEAPPKHILKLLSQIDSCVPAAKLCQTEGISKAQGNECIKKMEENCRISSPGDVGHPYPHTIILENAKKVLPTLKHTESDQMNSDIAQAYNKCEENQKWGYNVSENPISSKLVFYARTRNSKTVGSYDSQASCEQARLESNPDLRRGLEFDKCLRRYVGPKVDLKIYSAKAFFFTQPSVTNSRPSNIKEIKFQTLSECSQTIKSTSIHKHYLGEYDYEDITINPLGSSEENKFISECKPLIVDVCREGKSGYNEIEFN